jgi:hypothetical protein
VKIDRAERGNSQKLGREEPAVHHGKEEGGGEVTQPIGELRTVGRGGGKDGETVGVGEISDGLEPSRFSGVVLMGHRRRDRLAALDQELETASPEGMVGEDHQPDRTHSIAQLLHI